MKINPAHLGFDIDGVVADTGSAFLRLAKKEYGINSFSLSDITEFDVTQCLAIDPVIIDAIFEKLMTDPIKHDLKPMEDAVDVLSDLSRTAPLTFVTARPLKEPIQEWLSWLLGPEIFSNTRLIAMGDHDGKPTFIKKLGLKFFIDDRAETCIELATHNGIYPLVYSQPWNRGKHSLHQVDSWTSIRELCS